MIVGEIVGDHENDRGRPRSGGDSGFYLNDSQHDDNDKEEESNIECKSPIEIFVTRWIKLVTNTTTSSNTSI